MEHVLSTRGLYRWDKEGEGIRRTLTVPLLLAQGRAKGSWVLPEGRRGGAAHGGDCSEVSSHVFLRTCSGRGEKEDDGVPG